MAQFFKAFVGRDVDSLNAIPIEFFEPLSNLQRFSESLEYSEVLDQAVQCNSSMDRLLHVAVFAIANYAHTAFRFRKDHVLVLFTSHINPQQTSPSMHSSVRRSNLSTPSAAFAPLSSKSASSHVLQRCRRMPKSGVCGVTWAK